jgi:excisionase family DNA binding protein
MALSKTADPNDLMTASDAARIIGVSADMVRLLARGGKLAFTSTIRGVRLFRRADVDALAVRRAREKRTAVGKAR